MYIYLSLLVAVVGLLMYFVSGNPKVQETGRIMLFSGLLAFLLRAASETMQKVFIGAAVLLVLGASAMAQGVGTSADTPAVTNASANHATQELVDALTSSHWVLTAVGEWAPKADKGQFGGSAAFLYKANENLLLGPRIEYLNGQAEYVSGNATLQLPIDPHIGFWPSLRVTPWGYVGAGMPFGKKSGTSVSGDAAAGVQLTLWKSKNGRMRFGLLGGVEKRTDIPGQIYLGGPDFAIDW